MTHLVVFDLDGTLIDSRLDLARSANRLLEEFGARPLSVAQVVSMVGEGARVLVGRVLAAAGVRTDQDLAMRRFLEIYDDHLLDDTRLYDGVLDTLQALEGRAAMALLTNKPLRHSTRILDALGVLHFFNPVIGGDGDWPRKPDPSALQDLIASAGATPDTTIMVGDSMVDLETARRASARICIAQYGFGVFDPAVLEGALIAADARALAPLLLKALAEGGGR
jgi:phosphoglycolate phosphatase